MTETSHASSILALIATGTANSLLGKIVYQLRGKGRDGREKLFRKPWATTTLMFLAMTLCLPLAEFLDRRHNRSRKSGGQSALQEPLVPARGKARKEPGRREALLLAAPMAFDLIATVLLSVGLLYVTASVAQMLRGAEMMFAALLSILFLHRHINRFHLAGLVLSAGGIAMVGMSSILGTKGDAAADVTQKQILFGTVLIILAQGVQATQVVLEDYFLSQIGLHPLKVVGYEGLYGSIAMLCVALPIVQLLPARLGEGLHEDSLDTLHMITHSSTLPYVLVVYITALTTYNIAGMFVTDELGAATRTVLETMRTLFVWLVDLLIFYSPVGRKAHIGEPWDRYSYIQAIGFAVLIAGTLVYSHGDEIEDRKRRAKKTAPAQWQLIKATTSLYPSKPRRPTFRATARAVMRFQGMLRDSRSRSELSSQSDLGLGSSSELGSRAASLASDSELAAPFDAAPVLLDQEGGGARGLGGDDLASVLVEGGAPGAREAGGGGDLASFPVMVSDGSSQVGDEGERAAVAEAAQSPDELPVSQKAEGALPEV